jgi:O-Antigen ligase
MASWSSPQTILGLLGALIFAVVCYSDIRKGVLLFTGLGCIPVQIGAFSGEEITQGLWPAELLAVILVTVWLLRGRVRVRRASFNLPLLLLIPSSFVSLLAGFMSFDPTIPLDHMKLSVSMGQILITICAIGTYLTVAATIRDDDAIRMIRKIIVVMALPSLTLIASPERAWPYVGWSTAFALPASSLCFAEFFHTRSLLGRAALIGLTVAPGIYGFQMGKALFYIYVLVSMAVIVSLQARHVLLLVLATPLVFTTYVVTVPLASGSLIPQVIQEAIQTEESQQSLGGSGGRDQLVLYGLHIWKQYPVLGVGPANNYPYMRRYSGWGTPHDQYVNILMELGVVGLACFAAFAFGALRMGIAQLRTARTSLHRSIVVAWLGVFVAMLVGGLLGDFMIPSIRNGGLELFALFYVQWILLGVMVSINGMKRQPSVCLAGRVPSS